MRTRSGFFIERVSPTLAIVVKKDDPQGGAWFFLVPESHIKPLLDLGRDIRRAGQDLTGRINQTWGRQLIRRAA